LGHRRLKCCARRVKDGVTKSKPVYAAQIAVYQADMDATMGWPTGWTGSASVATAWSP